MMVTQVVLFNVFSLLVFLSLCLPGTAAEANQTELALWPQQPPSENGLVGDEVRGGCIGNISQASLTIHLPEPEKATGAAVVITPGGGYGVVCADTEGRQIAELLVPRGIAAIVLKYRLPNGHPTIPATDARRALRTVRYNAKLWNVDPTKVGIWGFSAGGHLASTVSTHRAPKDVPGGDAIDLLNGRPDFSILFYPVISMEAGVTHGGSRKNLLGDEPAPKLVEQYSNEKQISDRTPPTFLLHAADDQAVPVENSLRYYRRLVAANIPARLLIFEKGGHGPGAFKNNPTWRPVFEDWLNQFAGPRREK